MKRTLIAVALCAAFAGSAFAQANNAQSNDDVSGESPDYWANPAMVGSFFTDDTMTTLRPSEELRPAYDALSQEERDGLAYQCEQEETRGTNATALCSEIETYQ